MTTLPFSYGRLNSIKDVSLLKVELRSLFKLTIEAHGNSADSFETRIYELAGLLSLDAVRKMDDTDPYRQILELAGQLELPEHHRAADASWGCFTELVEKLSL